MKSRHFFLKTYTQHYINTNDSAFVIKGHHDYLMAFLSRFFLDFFIRCQHPPYHGGTESMMLHFIEPNNGAALWCCYFIDSGFGMYTVLDDQLCSPFDGLVDDRVGGLGVKSDLDAALGHGPHKTQYKRNSTGTQYCGTLH